MPCHHAQDARNVGPNLFACNENIAPCHAMWYRACNDIMCALCDACMQASRPPYVYVVCQDLLMDVPFVQAKQYLSKLTASHFGTLNTRFANQNVLERILITMHNENKADCDENFRISAEELVAPLYNC